MTQKEIIEKAFEMIQHRFERTFSRYAQLNRSHVQNQHLLKLSIENIDYTKRKLDYKYQIVTPAFDLTHTSTIDIPKSPESIGYWLNEIVTDFIIEVNALTIDPQAVKAVTERLSEAFPNNQAAIDQAIILHFTWLTIMLYCLEEPMHFSVDQANDIAMEAWYSVSPEDDFDKCVQNFQDLIIDHYLNIIADHLKTYDDPAMRQSALTDIQKFGLKNYTEDDLVRHLQWFAKEVDNTPIMVLAYYALHNVVASIDGSDNKINSHEDEVNYQQVAFVDTDGLFIQKVFKMLEKNR